MRAYIDFVRGFAGLAALALVPLLLAGCNRFAVQCDCITPGVTLTLDDTSAASVVAVRASGPACEGVTPRCLSQDTPCTFWQIDAKNPGGCHVEVDFGASGKVSHVVTIRRVEGSCCAGLYAEPPGSGDITVKLPATDGGVNG
jgi:hypothetical protein